MRIRKAVILFSESCVSALFSLKMSVVYDGVVPANGKGGDLFGGKKFWVSRAVPQRQRWVTSITVSTARLRILPDVDR